MSEKRKMRTSLNPIKKSKHTTAIMTAFVCILLATSSFLVFTSSTVTASDSTAYGDVMQYTWPQFGGNESWTRYGTGPAPSTGDILWKTHIPEVVYNVIAVADKVFVRNRTAVFALDPFTGDILWAANVYISWTGGMFAADDNHIVVGVGEESSWRDLGAICLDANTGNLIWNSTEMYVGQATQGSGAYVPETKQYYGYRFYDRFYEMPIIDFQQMLVRWDLSDISQPPKLVWKTPMITIAIDQGLVYGDGKIFYGSAGGFTGALDATTGDVLWETPTKGSRMYNGAYYMGMYLHGALGNEFYCFNATTGEILWNFNPGTNHGNWACGPAVANGLVYEYNYDTNLYCLNATTGQVVWIYKGAGNMYPGYPTVADGKVYATTGTKDYRNPDTGESGTDESVCLNATTGELIWTLPIATMLHDGFTSAYGNLYFLISFEGADPLPNEAVSDIWCIGSLDGKPKDWSMYLGDPAHTSSGAGPTNLELKWKTNVNGAVISSPTIVDGVTYVGSGDKNIYALDAETGNKIWNFTTGFRVFSSQAVVDGKVYTGTDDGNIYCIDAKTGTQLWKTFAGGITIANAGWLSYVMRSSPTVVSGKVYVGSLDGNLYCLDANNGVVNWKTLSPGPIYSTPSVITNDGVYFTSSNSVFPGNVTFYKINADNGNVIWTKSISRDFYGYIFNFESNQSPVVADGKVFTLDGSGHIFYCINAANGNTIWTYETYNTQTGAVNYDKDEGKVYVPGLFVLDCLNATNGEKLWTTWLNREIVNSITRAYGKVYVCNDEGFLYVLNSTTGTKLSYVKIGGGGSIWSSPSLYNNNLYIGTHAFDVYCFKEADLGKTTYYGASASPSPSLSASPSPTETPIVTSTPSPSTTPQTVATSNDLYLIVAAVVVIIVVIAVAAVVLRKRK
jgi:outer membrane protein assembly factor BamB